MNDSLGLDTHVTHDSREDDADLLGHVLTVARVVEETRDACSLIFEVPDELVDTYRFVPGQFLTIAVPSDRTGWVARCYSISSSPSQQELAITVKRTVEGYASNWLCDNVDGGDHLRVLPPSGLFTTRSPEGDLLLCAAGSGITPVMAILRSVLESVTGRVALYYANRDADSVIFASELAELATAVGERLVVEHWLEAERGLPNREAFSAWAESYSDREVFICGPTPFMDLIRGGVADAGFDTHRVRTEEYRSLTGDPFAPIAEISEESLSDAATVEVSLDDETYVLAWPTNYTLIDVMAAAGIDAPYACREGKCGACACELEEGTVDLGRTDALEAEDIAEGFILSCQAKPTSKSLKIEF